MDTQPVPGKVPIANPPKLPAAPLDEAAWAALVGRRVVVDVPASTANLGAGYDCLGMALDVCNTVTVEVTGAVSSLSAVAVLAKLPASTSVWSTR